jgi:large subunit ribosomal protein L21
MSYAIIEAGGTQLRVEPGRFYDLNHLEGEPEASYVIDKVLLVNNDSQITVGQPFVAGATVEGEILFHRRGRKIIVYKMRPKKKTRKKRGHRQELTRLLIKSISIDGTAIATISEDDLKKPVLVSPEESLTFDEDLVESDEDLVESDED